jgi:hypothetical protein
MPAYEFNPKKSYCVNMWLEPASGGAVSPDMFSPGEIVRFDEDSSRHTPGDRDWDVLLTSGRFCLILTWHDENKRWFATIWADPDPETRAVVDQIAERLVANGGQRAAPGLTRSRRSRRCE